MPCGVAACSGTQSALDPWGIEARLVADLFWVLVVAGAVIWLAVVGALVYATAQRRRVHSEDAARRLILWGGAIVPSLLLAILLASTFWLMPQIRPWAKQDDPAALRIEVVGEQFWWRVRYLPAEGDPVDAANEIRLPVGQRVDIVLASSDVIHSFWIPGLAGKMDMIPGRRTRFSVEATKPGSYRGACAEFCGTSHALMALSATAMEPAAFQSWLAARAAPAQAAGGPGHTQFMANGCAACHAIRGTAAAGVVGPDLSHLGSRPMLGAGVLPVTADAIARFIRDPDVMKPGSHMPAFRMLPESDIDAIATYLAGLR